MRETLGKYFDENKTIEVTMEIAGEVVCNFGCFGINQENKIFDDRYMIIYDQQKTPKDEIRYSSTHNVGKFKIDLQKLPSDIQKLVFTASIDGNGNMSEINSHKVTIAQENAEVVTMELNGGDFVTEKSIISIEIYRKDIWRISAVAEGFNGGLNTLLTNYGGGEVKKITGHVEVTKKTENIKKEESITLPAPKVKETDYEIIPLISNAGDDIYEICDVPLFDKERRKHYEAYICGMEYVMPVFQYEIKFNKDCIVASNIMSYFNGVREKALYDLKKYYKANVKNMDDWLRKALPKVTEVLEWMQEKAEKLLIASQIYTYNAKTLGRKIDRSSFGERIELVFQRYAQVCETEEQTKLMRELTRNTSSGRFVGGGFGFSGALGGIMAAGVANAGVGLARGVKNGVTAIGDEMRANANKRSVFQNPETYAVLEDILENESRCLENICRNIIDRETKHTHSKYEDWNKAKMLVVHAKEYSEDEDEFWKDILQALECCPYYRKAYEAIYTKYYKNIPVISQLREIYKLFLLDDIDEEIDALYEKEMQQVLKMPEGTSGEVEDKIERVKKKALEFELDERDELARLETVLADLRRREEEARKYNELLEQNIEIARTVEQVMKKCDFEEIFKMMEEGSMIAEEQYISYYIKKIRDEQNMKLYNSIASNAGKHRAYLCIVGVCSYRGWGTEQNIEIARYCIEKSLNMSCYYAKAFSAMTYLQGLTEIVDKTQAKEYLEELIKLASPTMLFYYGKALSSGAEKGGSNFIKNDYHKAVMFLEYAMKCHVLGAKESYEAVTSRGAEKVNAESYSSGGCYITTATCKWFGKSDDCYELTKFREYRDNILLNEPDGKAIIDEYYKVAPKIVSNIEKTGQSKEIYWKIWNEYLKKCLQYIENKEYAKCKVLYIAMVNKMKMQYL